MDSNEIARFIGQNSVLRRIAYGLIFITTLREWYIRSKLNKILSEDSGKINFLDAGSGLGQYAITIAKNNKNASVVAFELDEGQVEDCRAYVAKKRMKNISFYQGDLKNVSFDQDFNVILCCSVLEHIEEDEKVIESFYKALKVDGRILIYVPSRERRILSSLERMQQNKLKKSGKRYPHEHVRYYSADELVTKLQKVGFEIEDVTITYGEFGALAYDIVTQVQYSPFFMYIFPFYLVLLHPFVMILMLIDFIRENRVGNGLMVVARKG